MLSGSSLFGDDAINPALLESDLLEADEEEQHEQDQEEEDDPERDVVQQQHLDWVRRSRPFASVQYCLQPSFPTRQSATSSCELDAVVRACSVFCSLPLSSVRRCVVYHCFVGVECAESLLGLLGCMS